MEGGGEEEELRRAWGNVQTSDVAAELVEVSAEAINLTTAVLLLPPPSPAATMVVEDTPRYCCPPGGGLQPILLPSSPFMLPGSC